MFFSPQETFDNVFNLAYTFDEPEFEWISAEAKDFIRDLLVIDPTARASATEALAHPWLSGPDRPIYDATCTVTSRSILPIPDMAGVTSTEVDSRSRSRKTSYDRSRLKTFICAKNQWTKCANAIKAVQNMKDSINE